MSKIKRNLMYNMLYHDITLNSNMKQCQENKILDHRSHRNMIDLLAHHWFYVMWWVADHWMKSFIDQVFRIFILKILAAEFPITVIAFPEISGFTMSNLCVQPVFTSEVFSLWSNLPKHLIWLAVSKYQTKMWMQKQIGPVVAVVCWFYWWQTCC